MIKLQKYTDLKFFDIENPHSSNKKYLQIPSPNLGELVIVYFYKLTSPYGEEHEIVITKNQFDNYKNHSATNVRLHTMTGTIIDEFVQINSYSNVYTLYHVVRFGDRDMLIKHDDNIIDTLTIDSTRKLSKCKCFSFRRQGKTMRLYRQQHDKFCTAFTLYKNIGDKNGSI